MINLASAEWLFSLIILIIAYFVSVTINGVLQAKVASKLGDPTAEDMGYASFNPFVHLDPLSFIALILLHIGWPRFIPINPFNVHGPHRLIRLFIMHSTETVVSLIIAFVSLAISVSAFGVSATYDLASLMFISKNVPLHVATAFFSQSSSFSIVCALLLISFVFLNIFIAALSLIFNGFKFILILGFERGYSYMKYADYLTLFGPFIVVFLFANPLRYYLFQLIVWQACKMAVLFGAL